MKKVDADKLLRDKLNNFASDVPTDMWDKIDAARKPQKAAIAWGKIGATTVLLMTLAVAGALYWNSQVSVNMPQNVTAEVATTGADNSAKSTATTTINSTNTTANKQAEKTTTAISSTENKTKNTINTDFTSPTINSEKSGNENKIIASNKNAQVVENQDNMSFVVNEKTKTTNKIGATKTTRNNRISTDYQPPINWDIANAKTVIERAGKHSAATPRPEQKITDAAAAEKTVATTTTVDNTANATTGIVEPLLTLSPNLYAVSDYKFPTIECAEWKGRRLFFYTDLLGAVDIPYRTFKAKNSDFENYAHTRASTENVSFSGSVGMRFSMVLLDKHQRTAKEGEAIRKANKTGVALRTGFIYSQINEKYSRNIGTREEYTIINGDTTDVNIVPINDLGNNQYRMLDVPVIVGYEYDTEKYGFNVNAGAYFNILFDPRGRYATSINGQTVGASFDDDPQIYRDQLNVSLFASLALNYKLSPALHLLFEPYMRYHLDPITNDDYVLDQRYTTVGIQSGLRFKF